MTKKQEEIKRITECILKKDGFLKVLPNDTCLIRFSKIFGQYSIVFRGFKEYYVPARYHTTGKDKSGKLIKARRSCVYKIEGNWITINKWNKYTDSAFIIAIPKLFVDITMLKDAGYEEDKSIQAYEKLFGEEEKDFVPKIPKEETE